ncbi:hypothetical protein Tco_0366344 [Tanacetum coccineum]
MPYSHAVKGNWGTAVKTSAGYNWRNTRPNSNCNSGSNFVRTDHPLKNMEDRGIFDSGCSGHMTGHKDHLDDFEECKGGSVTFGGSKGYITSKGRIRVGVNTPGSDENRLKLYDLIVADRNQELQFKNNSKDNAHNILKVAHNEDIQRNLKFISEDQVRGGLLGIIVNRLKSGSTIVSTGLV